MKTIVQKYIKYLKLIFAHFLVLNVFVVCFDHFQTVPNTLAT